MLDELKMGFGGSVPYSMAPVYPATGSELLLTNTEILFDCNIVGFEMYSLKPGTIRIKVQFYLLQYISFLEK